ncbi:hypothetical protein B0O99DRAFT_591879 [Bisporella sp. PMI_857]|nr:hypothetical protein B0O99DRAFT_591879 [Bisporella sp. PMI_857]
MSKLLEERNKGFWEYKQDSKGPVTVPAIAVRPQMAMPTIGSGWCTRNPNPKSTEMLGDVSQKIIVPGNPEDYPKRQCPEPLGQTSKTLERKYSIQLDQFEKHRQHVVPPW